VFRSQYRGVSYDKKKRKWRVQIKVAALGKSGECWDLWCGVQWQSVVTSH
jgi:hypothetical protein